MFKLILEKELPKKEETVKVYECLGYQIKEVTNNKWNFITLSIESDKKYNPNIVVKEDLDDGKILEFKIQTTSYGSLESNKIEKIIEGYQTALKVVKELEKKYL